MTQRFVLIAVAGAAFAVTFMLSAWHEGWWGRSAQPPAALQAAPRPVPAPPPAVAGASLAGQPALPDPRQATPVAALTGDRPTATPDSTAAPASERESSEQRREAARGARTR